MRTYYLSVSLTALVTFKMNIDDTFSLVTGLKLLFNYCSRPVGFQSHVVMETNCLPEDRSPLSKRKVYSNYIYIYIYFKDKDRSLSYISHSNHGDQKTMETRLFP